MRITDFIVSKRRKHVKLWMRRAMEALVFDLEDKIILMAIRNVHKHQTEVKRLKLRSRHITNTVFNLNAFSAHTCMVNLRFKKQDINRLCELIEWPGVSTRNGYFCQPITGTCIFLHRLACTVRWSDVELKFGYFRSQLSEIFWEVVELFVHKFEYAVKLAASFFDKMRSVMRKRLATTVHL